MVIKDTSDIRKMRLKGNVESIEEFCASVDKNRINQEIKMDDLDFASTRFFRFDKSGNVVEEMIFTEFYETDYQDLVTFKPTKIKYDTKVSDGTNNIHFVTHFHYNKNGNLYITETLNKDEKLIEKSIWDFQTGKTIETYDVDGNKVRSTITQLKPEEKFVIEISNFFKDPNMSKKIITYDQTGNKTEEIHYGKESNIIYKIHWTYDINHIQKDEFNEKGFIKRTVNEYDSQGSIISSVLMIPIFQPEIKKIDWDKDYTNEKDTHFDSNSYTFQEAKKRTFKYEYDYNNNWVLRKTYLNNFLHEVTERQITYF